MISCFLRYLFNWKMVQMNIIFIFISSSDPNLFRKKSVKQKVKKRWPLIKVKYCSETWKVYFSNTCNVFVFLTRWKPFHRSAYLKSETDRRKAQPEDKKFFEALIKPKVHIPTICFSEYCVFRESSRMIVLLIH